MTEEIEDCDIQEALALLKAKREKEEEEKNHHDRVQRNIKNIFTMLGVDENKTIKIAGFWDANTLVHERQIWIKKRKGGFVAYTADSAGVGTLRNHYKDSLIERHKNEIYREKGGRDILNKKNHPSVSNESDRAVCFYENMMHECPFCGVNHSSEDKIEWNFKTKSLSLRDLNYDGWNITPDDFYKQAIKYRRCRHCKDTTRKEFLSYKCPYRKDINRLKLYHEIYPETQKNTKKYFAEKRVKKVTRNRSLTESEKTFFQMLLGANKLKSLIN